MRMVETNGWNQLNHSSREIAARDGLRQEMDCGWSWTAAGNRLRPEMANKRWIPSGGGSRPDIFWDRIWIDDRRWMTGGG